MNVSELKNTLEGMIDKDCVLSDLILDKEETSCAECPFCHIVYGDYHYFCNYNYNYVSECVK